MIQEALIAVAGTMAAVGLLRLIFLLVFRRPASAFVIGTDLSESERLRDRDMRIVAHYDNLPTADDIPFRGITCRVAFDVAGAHYRTDVTVLTYKGDRPDTVRTIWYDPSDPSRASGIGPEWALALMVPALALAVHHFF